MPSTQQLAYWVLPCAIPIQLFTLCRGQAPIVPKSVEHAKNQRELFFSHSHSRATFAYMGVSFRGTPKPWFTSGFSFQTTNKKIHSKRDTHMDHLETAPIFRGLGVTHKISREPRPGGHLDFLSMCSPVVPRNCWLFGPPTRMRVLCKQVVSF